ncbi:MAG TPA: TetR/AcrR family transcriptional regulator [Thermoleophilaceae bacterium]|nr:TetR/AcrR family transcriptional regulator [Thermoleophilaceae bacterium]
MTVASVDTRTQILAAARAALERGGYHGIGLADVAAASGFSRQAIYRHFGSKAGLLLAVVQYADDVEGLPGLREAITNAPTALEALAAFVEMVATLTPRIYATAVVLDAARRTDPDVAAAWSERMESRRRTCRRIVRRLADEGVLRPDLPVRDATDLLWSISSIHIYEALVITSGWSKPRFRRELHALAARALMTEAN